MIGDGGTQYMTAGDGILHIETPPAALVESGGLFHGLQLWINLPRAKKRIAPQYQDLQSPDLTLLSSDDGGALVRVLAGRSTAMPDRASRTRLWRSRTSPSRRAPSSSFPGRRSSMRSPTHCPAAAPSAPSVGPSAAGSWPSWVRASPSSCRPTRRRSRDHRTSRSSSSAACRCGSPWRLRPVRHVLQGGAGRGVRGLPGRPARHHPGRRDPAASGLRRRWGGSRRGRSPRGPGEERKGRGGGKGGGRGRRGREEGQGGGAGERLAGEGAHRERTTEQQDEPTARST